MGSRDTARRPGAPEDGARHGALSLLAGVLAERQTIADQMALPKIAALPPADRARAQRLALTTLRNLARADAVLKPLLRKPPPEDIRTLLRLATIELLVDGAAAHGVVNSAVALVRAAGPRAEPFAGMVNAVLRRVAAIPADAFAALPSPVLAPWLRRRLIEAWGKPAVQAIEAVQAGQPPVDLTPKSGDGAALAAAVGGVVLPTGSVWREALWLVKDGIATTEWMRPWRAPSMPMTARRCRKAVICWSNSTDQMPAWPNSRRALGNLCQAWVARVSTGRRRPRRAMRSGGCGTGPIRPALRCGRGRWAC